MTGVDSNMNSGRGPRLSVLNRHATVNLLKFPALIWSSGEYLVCPGSPPYERHSPVGFAVPLCPRSVIPLDAHTSAAATTAARLQIDPVIFLSPVFWWCKDDVGGDVLARDTHFRRGGFFP